ncbi:MAG: cytochrome c biogenesis protein ResB [Candidatus Aminicenantaceae bacterium]
MKSILRFFSSVKLAIVLFIIITSASIVGTLIPQGQTLPEYTARFGQLADLFTRLQLTDLYHSWWFIGLLFFFALNIIICTLTRLIPKLNRTFKPKRVFEPKNINTLKIKEKFNKSWSLVKTKEALKKEFLTKHYRLHENSKENKTYLLARKKIAGWFGADIVHLGLITILTGGIISGIGGFKKNLTFTQGDILSVPQANFKLRLDKFETEYYSNGNVRDWKSTLTVFEEEKPLFSKIIEVNHPLSYKGFVFYQSSYGWNWENPSLEIWVKKRNEPSFFRKLNLKVGEKIKLEDEDLIFSVAYFIPDFFINEKNEIISRSLEPNNPAAFIEGWQENEKIFSGWIFSKFPDYARIHSQKETNLSFELKDFTAGNFSVIQAVRDPGVNIIWLGCSFLMLGLALAFYWPPREVKIILEESHGKTEVTAGGIASKSKDALQAEFETVMTSIRRLK